MKIAYLQCPTGIAGDMCLGALVDAGVPLAYLTTHLERLGIAQEYRLWTESVQRNGLRATKFHVDLVYATGATVDPDRFTTFDPARNHPEPGESAVPITSEPEGAIAHSHPHSHPHPHRDVPTAPSLRVPNPQTPNPKPQTPNPIRHLPEIEHLILQAGLPARAEAWSLAVFRQLAVAEGAVHGVPPEQVHFHEVGATDALVDIIGTCLGLDWLGIDRLVCSPLPTGGGTIRAAHGRLPVPTPAVLKLFELAQVPIYSNGIDREMVTPTGAAIATTLAHHFGAPPPMTLQRVGLGAGSSEFALPNILQLWIGETEGKGERRKEESGREQKGQEERLQTERLRGEQDDSHAHPHPHPPQSPSPHPHPHSSTESIVVLETQIDDLNPQAIGYVLEELLAAGAVDVFTQAIAMKKSRPGMLLTVICQPPDQERCEAIVFRETTTLGIRCTRQERQILPRELQTVTTDWGPIRVKVAWAEGRDRPPTNVQPEYEDCAAIARTHQVPWRQVQRQALAAWEKAGGRNQESGVRSQESGVRIL